LIDPRLATVAAEHPYPLLFATVSGAHLYGFPSPDSDWDLRGVHVLPLAAIAGLDRGRETVEVTGDAHGLDLDLVTHDAEKFFRLMLRPNGYVLEQLHSPLVVVTTPEHAELREIARRCVTRHHVHHYVGFAKNQRKLLAKHDPPRVKPLLYVYRVLLTGIRLMRTGEVEANLVRLNEEFRLPYISDLVARKTSGAEKSALDGADRAFHDAEFERLTVVLQEAGTASRLPDAPSTHAELNDLLLRVRGCAT
jgi:predicted nucleotidyltransferase